MKRPKAEGFIAMAALEAGTFKAKAELLRAIADAYDPAGSRELPSKVADAPEPYPKIKSRRRAHRKKRTSK